MYKKVGRLKKDLPLPASTLWKSSILVEHTKAKCPIKILIKFNPSTQPSVTNCLVSAGLALTYCLQFLTHRHADRTEVLLYSLNL